MKALICREFGPIENLALEEVPDPQPGTGEVLIQSRFAALNFPDALTVQGRYQFRPELPFVPGGESAGTIEAVGADVEGLAPGDRVIAMGLSGAFAGKRVAPAADVLPIPDDMPLDAAAALMVAHGTSYYALKQCGKLQAGETLVVLGAAGGVGLAAVELGVAMGARVIAAASTDEKLELAGEAGAEAGINYSTADLKAEIKRLTDGRGADVVYDPVGGEYSEPALRATGWDGRFLVVGFAAGDIPRIPLNLVLLKNNAIQGVFYGVWAKRDPAGNDENNRELFDWFRAGQIRPRITATYPLDASAKAFEIMGSRRAMGKILIDLA
ncbi:NADPH:quinone oxidoreductase family protein [Elongatibacter sediminis]|uniref:NADPH:quinone oxidoreductase family protein n=1 Tax=Elongatibacter sediminis TaxID=3119006 RepID=A0AAW9RIG4_9GAMM